MAERKQCDFTFFSDGLRKAGRTAWRSKKKTGLKRISPVFAHCDCQKLSMTMLPVASTMPAICTGVSFSWKRKQE